jgi:hypothetical protein
VQRQKEMNEKAEKEKGWKAQPESLDRFRCI